MKIDNHTYPKAAAFLPYLQAIGRGQRSGRYLTQVEASEAMSMLLQHQITPEQRGAFLMLLRVREESAEEIAGFTQACRATQPTLLTHSAVSPQVDLDIGAYAGKRRQLPWFLLALACLVERGVKVGMHGTQEPESKRLYIQSVLSQLSLLCLEKSTHLSKHGSIWQAFEVSNIPHLLQQYGFVYADLALLHPALDELIQLREVFGLRSCANTLARMLNPFNANFSMQGVHHKHVDDKHMAVSRLLNEKNVLCFRGEGGEPEVDPSKEAVLQLCREGHLSKLDLDTAQRWEIKPKALEVRTLALVWEGAQLHSYGEKTIVGTLAALLILLEDKNKEQAFLEATKLFKARNRKRFLGADVVVAPKSRLDKV